MTSSAKSHYDVLGVDQTATIGEVRRAYRQLAKRYHPDKNRDGTTDARELFERATEAYRVLSDARQRTIYDRSPHAGRRSTRTPTHPEDIAYHVLNLLLDEQIEDALEGFDTLLRKDGHTLEDLDLPKYMNYQDARDAEFLIAEALERRGRASEAQSLYELALRREAQRPHFRAFTGEIESCLKRLYMSRLWREIEEANVPGSVDEALAPVFRLGVTRRERATCLKALGVALEAAAEFDLAREAVRRALEITPAMSGVKRLCQRLGLDDATTAGEPHDNFARSTEQHAE